jgi:hypothetical protein
LNTIIMVSLPPSLVASATTANQWFNRSPCRRGWWGENVWVCMSESSCWLVYTKWAGKHLVMVEFTSQRDVPASNFCWTFLEIL